MKKISALLSIALLWSTAIFAEPKFTVVGGTGGQEEAPNIMGSFILNKSGAVLIGQAGGMESRPFRWTAKEGAVWLPGLPDRIQWTYPIGMSDDGKSFVGNYHLMQNGDAPFFWKDGVAESIPVRSGKNKSGGFNFEDLNEGEIAGYSPETGAAILTRTDAPTIWTKRKGSTLLPTEAGYSYSLRFISGDGTAIFGVRGKDGAERNDPTSIVVWRNNDNPVVLQELSKKIADGELLEIKVVSEKGDIFSGVEIKRHKSGGLSTEAYRWSINGHSEPLGNVVDEKYGIGEMEIRAMSADAKIIVGNQLYNYRDPRLGNKQYTLPIVWVEGRGMLALEEYLKDKGLLKDGYQITQAQTVSGSGRVFAGLGVAKGQSAETMWIAEID